MKWMCGVLWAAVCKTLGLALLGLALAPPSQSDTLSYELLAVHPGTFPNSTFILEIPEALKAFRCSLCARKFFLHMLRPLLLNPAAVYSGNTVSFRTNHSDYSYKTLFVVLQYCHCTIICSL